MKKISANKIIIIIFVFAFILRAGYILILDNTTIDPCDASSYDRMAMNLIHGEGLQDKFYFDKIWYSFRMPVFPLFLSGIYIVFGHSFLAARMVQALLSALLCVIVYKIALKMFKKESVGLIAAGITAIYPKFIYYSGTLLAETICIFFLALSILYMSKDIDGCSRKNSFWAGLFLGLTALSRSITAIFLPFIFLWKILVYSDKRKAVIDFLIVVLFFTVTLSPWIVRNYIVHQKIVVLSTSGGYNFWLGNNPRATGGGEGYLPEDRSEFKDLTETAMDKLFYKKGFSYIRRYPGKFLRLCGEKVIRFWRLCPHSQYVEWKYVIIGLISFCLILPFAVWGIILSVKFWPKQVLLYFIIICYTLAHMFFIALTRYRVVVMPYLIIFASLGLDSIRGYINKKTGKGY